MPTTQRYHVPISGIGRADYSQDIQKSVEPLTQDWQSGYHNYDTFNIIAGDTIIKDYPITSGYVTMLYDVYLSVYPSADIELSVQIFTVLGNWGELARKAGVQFIDVNVMKGFPVFPKYRVLVINHSLFPVDAYLCIFGITTAETIYYGTSTPGLALIPP